MAIGLSELADLYQAGTPLRQIMQISGHGSPAQIYRRLDRAGIAPDRARRMEEDPVTLQARHHRETGKTFKQIAELIHMSVDSVRRRITYSDDAVRKGIETVHPSPQYTRKIRADERINICRLRKMGMKIQEIAIVVRRSITTVRDVLYGPPSRPRKRRPFRAWPKIRTTMERALKGRNYEDYPVPPPGDSTRARRNAILFEQRGANTLALPTWKAVSGVYSSPVPVAGNR